MIAKDTSKEKPHVSTIEAVTLDQVITLARQLSPLEKIRLIEQIAPEIERHMQQQGTEQPDLAQPKPLRSLLGLCADLGPAPSAEDIDEIRKEMWGDFPREDI
jgi:transcriptional regulatory protein LevR